jgi:hypothetical protein
MRIKRMMNQNYKPDAACATRAGTASAAISKMEIA